MVTGGRFYVGQGNYRWVDGWGRIRSGWSGSLSLFRNRTSYKRSSSSQGSSLFVGIPSLGGSFVRRYKLGYILGRIGSLAALSWG